ncbi:MAG: cyclase family protein [Nitrospirales bacterium]
MRGARDAVLLTDRRTEVHGTWRAVLLIASVVACAACATAGTAKPFADPGTAGTGILVDLTYAFGQETIYWPTNQAFQWEATDWGPTEAGYWYASARFSASEHGGTHIDAPIHFAEGRHTVDRIPLAQLIGPAAVIDIRTQCKGNPDYELAVADLRAWETRHGRLMAGAVVLIRTGWGDRWPDRRRYLGSNTPDDPQSLHFPGLSREAAEFLVTARAIRGVGIDTASIDPGQSRTFPAHQALNQANLYVLENVASLDRLPPLGATVLALPMKIQGGSGGPVRIIAWVP